MTESFPEGIINFWKGVENKAKQLSSSAEHATQESLSDLHAQGLNEIETEIQKARNEMVALKIADAMMLYLTLSSSVRKFLTQTES